MEENYSDTEHIIATKRNDKFQQRVKSLRNLILVLLAFGAGLSIFSIITWNNNSNEILRSLAVTGLVTIFAAIIGLVGCNRCLRHLEVVRTNKMKQSEGQESLLIFFYFDFLLFCAFLLFGTWCFFYQDDATAWLEAKYTDKEAWERDFKGISLATVQNNLKLILTIAGILSLVVGVITFACIYYAMKISVYFETIHTIVQVQNLVIVLISFLIIYAGAIAQGYYQVPWVSESEPEFLPQVLMITGGGMIMVSFLGFFATKSESKIGLISYTVLCVFLMLNFLIFIVLLNFGSQQLQSQFEEKCNEVMPWFHKNFYESFGCQTKYIQNTTDPAYLQCPKDQIATIWEQNVDVFVDDQSDQFGCLNEKCCIAMISFVKGKFNFLAAFCIVAFFFILVVIMTSQYMYKKIKKYQTQILSHRNDNTLLVFMLIFTIGFASVIKLFMPEGPKGMPQPDKSSTQLTSEQQFYLYDLHVDRTFGLGQINEEGWWNFERLSLFQVDYNPKSNNTNQTQAEHDQIRVEVSIQSYPANGEFQIVGEDLGVSKIDNTHGNITVYGTIEQVNITMSQLLFRPGCILNRENRLDLNLTFYNGPRLLQETAFYEEEEEETVAFGVPRRYSVSLNLNSGYQRAYRGKIVDINKEASGVNDQFREVSTGNDIKLTVNLPFFQKCDPISANVNNKGVFEFNMTILNQTIPYLMKVQAERNGFTPIIFDYFVGGFPRSTNVEMGTYAFFTPDQSNHNVTGRLFEAFTNKTFQEDYTLSVYQGYGELNRTRGDAYEVIDYYGNGVYYTGDFEMYDLKTGSYVAVVDTPKGFIRNFQRFYALPYPYPKQMRSIPLVPELNDGELSLVLTWQYSPKDLDIHVEFVASPTILCKCDYTMHQCGGLRYMSDAMFGGDKGADAVKFDYVGDFQYIVYVSLHKHKGNSPKAQNTTSSGTNEVTLAESQAQLKVFAPYYSWPVFIFDLPAAAANPTFNYWTVFCFNGRLGLRNLKPINALTQGAPDVSTCHDIYGTPEFMKRNVDLQEATEDQP